MFHPELESYNYIAPSSGGFSRLESDSIPSSDRPTPQAFSDTVDPHTTEPIESRASSPSQDTPSSDPFSLPMQAEDVSIQTPRNQNNTHNRNSPPIQAEDVSAQTPHDQNNTQARNTQQPPKSVPSRRYHKKLNAKICDQDGTFLEDRQPGQPPPAPPPPRNTREKGDWFPFGSQVEFEFAEFVYCKTQMSAANTNVLMKLVASLRGGDALFANHNDICETIDATELGGVPWERASFRYQGTIPEGPEDTIPEWMTAEYEIYFRDPSEVVKNIIADPTFDGAFDYAPYQAFDENGERQYENLMSGDWAFRQADIIAEDDETHGAMFVPIILGSDKTTVSVGTGDSEFWPLYMSVGNVHNRVRRAHANAVVLIGFLSIPKTDKEQSDSEKFRNFRRQMFHASLVEILRRLKPAMSKPEVVRCPDGHYRLAIYGLGPYIADYPEQVLITCIVKNWCAKCTAHWERLDEDKWAVRRTRKLTEVVEIRLELLQAWDLYGVVAGAVPFTEYFPRADVYELITPDLLHQLIKGTFKDHLVDWVEAYLKAKHGKTKAKKILADIDRRIAAAAPFSGLRRFPQGRGFKQWTGDDSKALMKVYLPAIEGYVPVEMIRCFRAFLEFCYIARHDTITESQLSQLKDALDRFHHYRLIFRQTKICPGLSLPRQHSMKHYLSMIRLFGAPNGLCSSITESKHIKAVKEPWRRSNRYQPLHQILYINQRLDKLAAMRTDFTQRGMLQASGLRAALDLIEQIRSDNNPPIKNNGGDEEDADEELEEDEENDSDLPPVSQVKLARRIRSKIRMSNLVDEFGAWELTERFRRFLYDLKFPNATVSAQQVSINACPAADPQIFIVGSASATFYAPSDRSGVNGRRKERIRATSSWRNGSSRYDTVLIQTGLKPGPRGLSVARLRMLFNFEFEGNNYPTALVEWFSFVGEEPDEDTGMWMVERETHEDGSPMLDFIRASTIVRACHLLPVFGNVTLPRSVTHENSLDVFKRYYLNKFADHHAFEILSSC